MEKSQQARLINTIVQIGHGEFDRYTAALLPVADPALLAHLTAYAFKKVRVTDTQAALAIAGLRLPLPTADAWAGLPGDMAPALIASYVENAVAHALLLAPHNLVKAVKYHEALKRAGHPPTNGGGRALRRGVAAYLRLREAYPAWFDRLALQNRADLAWLYEHYHVRPSELAQTRVLGRPNGRPGHPAALPLVRPIGSVWEALAVMRTLPPAEQAALIQQHRIPYTVAVGAVSKASDPVILRAIIDNMSGTEVLTNAARLEKLVANDAACRGALEAALTRAQKSNKTETLKGQKAADKVSAPLAARLETVTQARVDAAVQKINANALIIGDRSGSMHKAVEAARQIAALTAQRVTGNVRLSFVNTTPWEFDVSGKTLAEIYTLTGGVTAAGGTALGCGIAQASLTGFAAEMIVIVSDGGENSAPYVAEAYRHYEQRSGLAPSVTFVRLPGDPDKLSGNLQLAGIPFNRFDLDNGAVDTYNLGEIVNALRPGQYGLVTDVLETPLLTVADALARSAKQYAG